MKTRFTILGLLLSFLINAQIVNIPDANFKACLVGNSFINSNGDSEIQVSEAVAISGVIDCSHKNIINLTGIEAFINISYLTCNDNQLTSLDVSKNTDLISLDCSNNQLIMLDVSKNNALRNFYCDNNQLTSLNLNKNTDLRNLNCNNNLLQSLDLSKNNVLMGLNCRYNKLSVLNLKNTNNGALSFMVATNNPNLVCIQVDNIGNANSHTGWTKDSTAAYNTDCGYLLTTDSHKKGFAYYPNPATKALFFLQPLSDIQIIDMSGRHVISQKENTIRISVEKLPKGNYIITARDQNGNTVTQKFIKE